MVWVGKYFIATDAKLCQEFAVSDKTLNAMKEEGSEGRKKRKLGQN